jgi:monovalent cation/proton antiporter MnhG/PhaG subunit
VTPPAPAGPAATIFLIFALVVCALSCLGLFVMKGFYNKLHFLAPPAILGTAGIALAVLAKEGLNASAIKAGLVLLVLVISNPILTFAAARAKHVRDEHTERPGVPQKQKEEDKVTPLTSRSLDARK